MVEFNTFFLHDKFVKQKPECIKMGIPQATNPTNNFLHSLIVPFK